LVEQAGRDKASSLGFASDDVVGSNNWRWPATGSRAATLCWPRHASRLGLPPIWYRMLLIYPVGQAAAQDRRRRPAGTPNIVAGSNGHVAWVPPTRRATARLIRLDQIPPSGPGQLGEDWNQSDRCGRPSSSRAPPRDAAGARDADGPIRESNGQVYAIHWLAQDPRLPISASASSKTPPRVEALDVAASAGVPN